MARILAVDDVPVALRNSLLRHLTAFDEAVILPQAAQSSDSAAFKNVCFRLCATQETDPNLLPVDLFCGVSICRITAREDVSLLQAALDDTARRASLLATLAASVPSELHDENVTVGCSLDCEEDERDLESDNWVAGFADSSSFVGIFSAQNSRPPEVGLVGQSRVHDEFFLVCKAGGGLAASTFHARLRAELVKGRTLENALSEEGVPGATALRRCASAGQRNRGRIMAIAAKALGLKLLSEVGDQPARNKAKIIVPDVEVVVNSLRRLETCKAATYQLACCTDLALSKGCAWLSNASDGLTLLLQSNSGDVKVSVNNDTFGCVPFSTPRLKSSRDVTNEVVHAHRSSSKGHTDKQWIKRRFSWKNASVSPVGGHTSSSSLSSSLSSVNDIEPFAFYGSHAEESFSSIFSRELGISTLKPIKLRPELVAVAGVDPGKLRGVVKAI